MMASSLAGNKAGAVRCISIGRLLYSPLLKASVERKLMKVLKPSSIQAYLRSLLPTIIGNQLWPNSWSVTPHRLAPLLSLEQNTIPGYSMPPTMPATLVATG